MVISHKIMNRRLFLSVTTLGGWAAIPFMTYLALAGRSNRLALTDVFGDPVSGGNGWAWVMATLAMMAVIGGMTAVITVDALRVLRRSSRPKPARKISSLAGALLSSLMWFFGGIISIGLMLDTSDCGVGAVSPCLDRPGLILSVLYILCLILPTPLLVVAFWLGRRSEVCALLAPPFIACIYLLAVHLQLPHVGFGDVIS